VNERAVVGAPGVDVSPARPEEYAALGDAVLAAYDSLPVRMSDEYRETVRDVARRAGFPDTVVLAARLNGAPVGGATVAFAGSPMASEDWIDAGTGVLRMLGVDPRARGRGAGRALVEAALDVARTRGMGRMRLWTQPFMPAAQRLYEALGFTRFAELDREPMPEVCLLGYQRSL
jgi:GNAT superfamily N-acetyltransferase